MKLIPLCLLDDLNDLKIMIVPLNLLHAQKNGISFKYVIIGGGYLENDLKRLVNNTLTKQYSVYGENIKR